MKEKEKEGRERRNFKELAPTIAKLGKSKICRAGEQVGDPGKSQCCSSSLKAVWGQNSLFLKGISLFSINLFN